MFLIDTSAWISFFNHPESKAAKAVLELIDENASACINGLIEMELLQGARTPKQADQLRSSLKDFQYFPNLEYQTVILAAEIYRKCRRRGVTIRKSLDCIIAANALEQHLTIVHQDRDFELIRSVHRNLKTFPV